MRVIPPVEITDTKLTSSSAVEVASPAYDAGTPYALNATASIAGSLGLITEYKSLQASNTGHTPASAPLWWERVGDTYQVYSSGATYAEGERVIDDVNHMVYESKVAGNIGNALTDDTKWLEVGRTNRWAMFDLQNTQPTISPSPLTVALTLGQRCNAIGLGYMVANRVDISVSSGGLVVYSMTEDLNTREVFNYYDYCFKPFSTKPSMIRFDLPPYTDAIITVTISATEGDVEVGAIGIGSHVYCGEAEFNAEDDAKNYSSVDRNFDGTINRMVPRLSIPMTNQTLVVDKSRVNSLRKLRAELNGKTAIWSGLDDDNDGYFEALFIFGFYTQFKFNLARPTEAVVTLAVESI